MKKRRNKKGGRRYEKGSATRERERVREDERPTREYPSVFDKLYVGTELKKSELYTYVTTNPSLVKGVRDGP